ncbi:MAG: potassium channel family protein [Synechococcus sp.]|nr:potassium channel family protein [Synechococcus sp.]
MASTRSPGAEQPELLPRGSSYGQLLSVCLLVLASFTLPQPWNRLSSLGYVGLAVVMIRGLGNPSGPLQFGPLPRRLFKGLGWAAVAAGLLWSFTPLELRSTGVSVIALWALFSGWAAIRLIRSLALELRVSDAVLRGALAGYLMLGLAAGLLCCALETIDSASFSNVLLPAGQIPNAPSPEGQLLAEQMSRSTPVWALNFVRLNYFAFVSLTTMGYGDVIPQTPQAQMVSVAIAIAGTFYVAAVMGVLISRLTVQESQLP